MLTIEAIVDTTTEYSDAEIDAALQDLDARVAKAGGAIWIGSEPTFTDRFSENAEWVCNSLGDTKEDRAKELLRNFVINFPGCAILRTVGRQYIGEQSPRWSMGLLAHRDGGVLWSGPPDPLLLQDPLKPQPYTHWPQLPELDVLRQSVLRVLENYGFKVQVWDSSVAPQLRLLCSYDDIVTNKWQLEHIHRPSIHSREILSNDPRDELAKDGFYLFTFDTFTETGFDYPTIELPGITDVNVYVTILEAIAEAANAVGLQALVLRGYPPPVNRHLLWSTITPDPAVIEINLAPATSLTELFSVSRALFAASTTCNLHPYRLYYNGREADSGGGGQFTIGGPTPEDSPFFIEPWLLPRLIRYFHHHPALSYWFASDYLGSGSQAPRFDEGPRERWSELELALRQLERRVFSPPAFLWACLTSLLVDSIGNPHRCEINVEKLWNPYIGTRGLQGLVELRPFRMAPDAKTIVAIAALLLAIVARLKLYPFDAPIRDWGNQLHQHFALPYNLVADLKAVFGDLAAHNFGLAPVLTDLLLNSSWREIGHLAWQGVNIKVSNALEFWPLLGEACATGQQGDSRLVDSSTSRIELLLEAIGDCVIKDWQLRVNGFAVPLYSADTMLRKPLEMWGTPPRPLISYSRKIKQQKVSTKASLTGIRYRSYLPRYGLHPQILAIEQVNMVLIPPNATEALSLTLLEWRPQGGGYPGLPEDLADARRRRQERLLVTELPTASLGAPLLPPDAAISEMCFDLRYIIPITVSAPESC